MNAHSRAHVARGQRGISSRATKNDAFRVQPVDRDVAEQQIIDRALVISGSGSDSLPPLAPTAATAETGPSATATGAREPAALIRACATAAGPRFGWPAVLRDVLGGRLDDHSSTVAFTVRVGGHELVVGEC